MTVERAYMFSPPFSSSFRPEYGFYDPEGDFQIGLFKGIQDNG
jgi:hypothetical protein